MLRIDQEHNRSPQPTRDETSRNITSTTTTESPKVVPQLEMMNKNFPDMMRQIQSAKSVSPKCETCGGPHCFTECPAIDGYTQEATYATTGNHNSGGNSYQPQGDSNMLSYHSNNYLGPPGQAPNNQGRGKNFNQGNNNYQAPNFQAPNYQAQVGPSNELTNYMKSNEATLRAMQTQMTNMKTELQNEFKSSLDTRTNKIENQNNQIMNMLTNLTMQKQIPSGSGSLPGNTVANLRGDVKSITTRSGVVYDGPTIPPTSYPLPKEVERETEATKDKFASTFKSLLSNKKKLFELASTPLNENCSVVFLKKLPEKLGDPGKFLIPCDFPELDECLALADLGASINLMPLSVWKKLLLLELTPTCMTLELANRSVAIPVGVAEDVFVKVGKRPFLRTACALIDVHGEELTLHVNDKAITFKVRHTSRYSHNYYDELVNRIDVIDVTCEEYAQEVLGFSDSSKSGNPTPSLDPIITTSLPSLTPFEGGDFILEEIKACILSDSIPPGIDDADFDPEGDIRLLEKLLNNDPSSPLPLKELNFEELKTIKSSIDDPLELELKDLPSHLEYAFLERTDKLPIIISKELKDEEKAALLKILKSYKRAIAWKIFDIKGIDPSFCTRKILMEDDFKPAVQHQRRVNPKIHKVIKKEVIKLLDVGLIYPLSDSPWVSPVHCVPKKGGMTVIENNNNELIPTRLVTGWRV
ncbi:reverse transcriptase domain-containing protein [Tanacetum coccineum]